MCEFSWPWFLVAVFAIIAIRCALMWLCEYSEKKYYQDRWYNGADYTIFWNRLVYNENQHLYNELIPYRRLASRYGCIDAKALERLIEHLCTSKETDK